MNEFWTGHLFSPLSYGDGILMPTVTQLGDISQYTHAAYYCYIIAQQRSIIEFRSTNADAAYYYCTAKEHYGVTHLW